VNNPEDESYGKRQIPFSGELWVEESDFMENPVKNFHRLAVGNEVRLVHAYYVTVTGFSKDAQTGRVTQIRASYDAATRGGWSSDGRKVKGTIHWVSASHSADGIVYLYDHLFVPANPDAEKDKDFSELINPESRVIQTGVMLEPSLSQAETSLGYQFLRNGYFRYDERYSAAQKKPVFLRTVGLKDSWKPEK